MLVTEQAEAVGKRFDLKLFATDVTEGMLSSARAGQYPASIAIDVGEQRLQRFFEMQDDTYRIKKTLRETIIFAPQNLLQDPPFSRLDLISCRNLLIYLEPDFQKRVLGLFHFALREGGHLFLGPAETTAGQEELFQPDLEEVADLSPARADPPRRGGLPADRARRASHRSRSALRRTADAEPRVGPGELIDQALIERYAPASALIDARCRVHYLRGPTDQYLRPPSGEPSYNLLAMAREGLQMPLRAAVRKALDDGQEVTTAARVRRSASLHPVRLVVSPLKTGRAWSGQAAGQLFRARRPRLRRPPADAEERGRGPAAGGARYRARGSSAQHRADGGCERGAEGVERGDPLDQRGAAGLQRGAGDLEGGAAVAQ